MTTPYRIRRRALGGASGAPSSLLQSELCYSEVDQVLFIGQGTGGSATVVAIGGPGAYLTSATAASTYATQSSLTSYLTVSSASSTYLSQSSAAATYAPLASPALSGTPTAPTASAGTSSTQIATTAFVATAVSNLVNGAPEALNTLQELAAALNSDASFSTTVSTAIGGKLAKADNLSDLTDASTARTNLGLGSMATQAANNVAITGGTIDGVTLDGGTY